MKVVRLSALGTGRLYPQGNIPGTHFCQPQGHSAAGRTMSMKNANEAIGNRTRDLPACSAVPQPTVPPAACPLYVFQSTIFCVQKEQSVTAVGAAGSIRVPSVGEFKE